MSNKALLFIFFFLLLVGAVVFLIFYFSQKQSLNEKKFTATPPPQEENQQDSKNIVYASSIEQLVSENVISPIANSKNDKILYIDGETSGIYELDPVLKTKEKIGSPHPGVISEAIWSPDKSRVILKYEDQKFVYGLKTGKEFPLDKNVQGVIFGKNSDKIFYQFFKGQGRTEISRADGEGKNWKNLIDYPLSNVKLGLISNSSLIYFCPPSSGFQKTSCYQISESGQDFKTLTQEEYGQDIKYSPDGAKILYTSTIKKGMDLGLNIMDSTNSNKKHLQINTLVDKCVFGSNNKIYCAVPELIPTDSVMPDDYYAHRFITNDIFWEIDPEEISKSRLTETKDFKWGNNDASNLFFLKDGKNLFFTSNNGLYVLHLKTL